MLRSVPGGGASVTIREISSWKPTSRGKVRCSLCFIRIPKGDQYKLITFTDEATVWTWKECADCEAISAAYSSEYPYEEIYQENVVDWALGAAKSGPHQEIAESFLRRFGSGKRVQLCHLDSGYREESSRKGEEK